jgi:uncharacterized protein (DUF433 family)
VSDPGLPEALRRAADLLHRAVAELDAARSEIARLRARLEADARARAVAELHRAKELERVRRTPRMGDTIPGRGQNRLTFDPKVSEDSPVVKGTLVTVNHVVSLILDGWTYADIIRAHPDLTEDDIRTYVAYNTTEAARK